MLPYDAFSLISGWHLSERANQDQCEGIRSILDRHQLAVGGSHALHPRNPNAKLGRLRPSHFSLPTSHFRRAALGAEPSRITRQIVTQSGRVALIGIGIGLLGASAGGQLIASVLYGVNPRDPIVFTMMAVTLLLVALAACWLPARRAAKLDPTIALRAE